MARAIVASLPLSTANLLQSDEWKGGPLLTLPESKGVRTPTSKEISGNYWFVKPVVQAMPRKVKGSKLKNKLKLVQAYKVTRFRIYKEQVPRFSMF